MVFGQLLDQLSRVGVSLSFLNNNSLTARIRTREPGEGDYNELGRDPFPEERGKRHPYLHDSRVTACLGAETDEPISVVLNMP